MSFIFVADNLLKLHNQLLKFAYSLTLNDDDAKDLLQDTILKTLENHEKFIENTNFKSWASTIMKNLFITDIEKNLFITTRSLIWTKLRIISWARIKQIIYTIINL